MTISSNILTNAGLTKIQLPSLDSSDHKIRLYRRSTQNSGTLIRVQEALEQQLKKGRRYEGDVSKWEYDASAKLYLLKEGKILKRISEEYALELQSNPSSLVELKKSSLDDVRSVGKDSDTQHDDVETYDLNSAKILGCHINNFIKNEGMKKIEFEEKDLIIIRKLKDMVGEEAAYSLLGNTYDSLGDFHKSIKFYEQALINALDFKDHTGEGRAYSNLGNSYYSLGQYHKSIEFHEKALMMALELKDPVGEGRAYNNLGINYSSLGRYLKSIEFHDKSLILALELKDLVGQGMAYGNLGNAYRSLGENHKAIYFHEKHLVITLNLKDRVGEGKAYSNLGIVCDSLGEYRKAIDSYEKALMIALELKDFVGEGMIYGNLGNAYRSLGECDKSIEFHKKHLTIALRLKDRVGEGAAYGNLGNAYHSLGEYHKGIESHEKYLKITLSLKDRVGEGKAYGNLGIIYDTLGEHRKAIEAHEKSLTIALELKDRVGEGAAYGNLGSVFNFLGDYRKAIEFYKKYLRITHNLTDRVGEGVACSKLGNTYYSLGEYRKAIEFHERHLKICLELKDLVGERAAYGNLGNAYNSLEENRKAIELHEKHLAIALELKDSVSEEKSYNNLGNVYMSLGEYHRAIEFYEKALMIALELKNRVSEGKTHCNIGNAYQSLGECHKAIDCYKKDLTIALDLQDCVGEERACSNLGNACYHLKKYEQAKEVLYQSIKIAVFLQQNAKKSQWQINLFERLSSSYFLLEKTLLRQKKTAEALEISDSRRVRALASLIMEKFPTEEPKTHFLDSLTFKEIKDLAKKLHTTFITYSLADFEDNQSIQAWIISPDQNQELISISLSSHLEEFKDIDTILKIFPYGLRPKAQRGVKAIDPFKERLSRWYELLIAPLASYLPGANSGQTLTFIPDNFLAHLPFGAFYNKAKNQYLIEKYPISVAPSIKVLSLLDKLPKLPADQALVIGNPTTPIEADNQLKFTRIEVEEINQLFHQKRASESLIQTQTFTETLATAENILREAPLSHLLHMTGHGVMDEPPGENLDPGFDPHSVFKGLFKLAKDDKHPLGQFRSKEIADMILKADLVFMSACHLGRGNIKREGSIGPIWSFLGAGAKSTVASYWPLPDSQVTVKMVKTFYQHFLGLETPGVSKAHALREAIIVGMQENRDNIDQWGAFFLSGLMN